MIKTFLKLLELWFWCEGREVNVNYDQIFIILLQVLLVWIFFINIINGSKVCPSSFSTLCLTKCRDLMHVEMPFHSIYAQYMLNTHIPVWQTWPYNRTASFTIDNLVKKSKHCHVLIHCIFSSSTDNLLISYIKCLFIQNFFNKLKVIYLLIFGTS